jgi:hypothetical protein
MDPDPEIAAALTAVGGDPDDEELRRLASVMLCARADAEAGIAQVRSWIAGESTALGRADPALLHLVAARVTRWQAARQALAAAAWASRDGG